MSSVELRNKVKDLWNKFWSGGISNPLDAIQQITYLLFMKQLDEFDIKKKGNLQDGFIDKHESIFVGKFKAPGMGGKEEGVDKETLRWSYWKHLPADDMLRHVQTLVFPFIKSLGGDASHFTKHMENAVFIIPKPSLLVEAVKSIDDIYNSLKAANRFIDAQGDFYEFLLKELSGAGKNGQFRTPTHLIEMIVELVNPKLGHRIADPACGSAGFLLGAYKYIITQYSSDKQEDEFGFIRGSLGDKLIDDKKRKILESQTFYGYDIDPTMIRIGLMNLMMHGIRQPQIDYKDTLSNSYNEDGVFDCILANPPYTGSIDKGDINESFELDTTKTELLFLERIYKMLRIGGKAGVVVPQGVLFGSGKVFKQLRQLLIDRCELKAVISMPSGFFKPYTGVATAVLVFVKGGKTENVWFYDMKSDGLSLDDKRNELFKKDGTRDLGDLHKVIQAYHSTDKTENRKLQHFLVSKNEIVENGYELSFNRYHMEEYEEVRYEAPAVILDKLSKLESNIQNGIEELRGIIG